MYKEKCGGDPVLGETILCQEAKEYYNLIFTCCIISSVGLHKAKLCVKSIKVGRNYCVWNSWRQAGSLLDEIAGQFYDYCWSVTSDILPRKWLLHNGMFLAYICACRVLYNIKLGDRQFFPKHKRLFIDFVAINDGHDAFELMLLHLDHRGF